MLAICLVQTAWAQDAGAIIGDATEADSAATEEIVVSGRSFAGRALSVLPPELQLDEEEVASYGVSSVGELIAELSVLTRSGRGRGGNRPVILVNGQRTASETEVRELPTEAIRRVDVLSEEAALQYGFSPDQRVLNFVLQKDFRALTVRSDLTFATDGGRRGLRGEAGFLSTSDNGRWSVGIDYRRDARLLESERDIVQPPADIPYGFTGVFGPVVAGATLDPALDLAAGAPVRFVPVPESAAAIVPGLSALVPLANRGEAINAGQYRSLLPDQRQFRLNATFNRRIGPGTFLTLSGLFEEQQRQSLLGLADISLRLPSGNPFSPFSQDVTVLRVAAQPRQRDVTDRTIDFGAALTGNWAQWQWSLTGQFNRVSTDRQTARGFATADAEALLAAADPGFNPYSDWAGSSLAPGLIEIDRIVSHRLTTDFVVNGRAVTLPAGAVSTSLRVGFESARLSRSAADPAMVAAVRLKRDRLLVQGNIDVPVVAAGMSRIVPGDLTLNANAEWRNLSDFGNLLNYGAGLNWQPVRAIRLTASFNREQAAPDLADLGNPVQITPGYRIFDAALGSTAEVSRIDGGNPGLTSDTRDVFKLGIVAEPLDGTDLTVTADYVWQKVVNPVRSFPVATPEILLAFPDRSLRDPAGRLTQIDVRPVNLARSERENLRWGATWRSRMGRQADSPASRQRTPMPGRERGDRLQLSIFHVLHLADRLTVAANGPVFDYLGGSALNDRGGQPRHEIQVRAGVNKSGVGLRLEADWLGPTRVTGITANDDLRFADNLVINARLFGNLERMIPDGPGWAKGTRVSIDLRNLFNRRPAVSRVADGSTPLAYQPATLEALGRSIRLSLRKQF
ncbi:MAG: TonB-dependent receptor [Novosphingobium sp.]|nr:TonB-dependent receptor [Novosphingobium sp.]